MESIITTGVFLFCFYFLYVNFKRHNYWARRGIKGPTPWPLLGTNIYYIFKNKVDVDLKFHEQYGGVYGLYDGYEPVLCINDNELARHVFVTNFKEFSDRGLKGVHSSFMRNMLFFTKGKVWAKTRTLLTQMLTSIKVKNFTKTISGCVEELSSQIDKTSSSDNISKRDSIIDRGHFLSFGLDVLLRTLFCTKMKVYKADQGDFHKRAFEVSKLDVGFWIFWNLTPRRICSYFEIDQMPRKQFQFLIDLSQMFLDKRRKEGVKKNDIIQAMLDAEVPSENVKIFSEEDDQISHFNDNQKHDELEKVTKEQSAQCDVRSFTDEERQSNLVFLYIAGFDTTSSSLSFCFHALSQLPDEQEDLYEEIIANIDESTGVIEYEHLSKLPKLDAFIAETLRMFAPVIFINRLVSTEEPVVLPHNPPIKLDPGVSIIANPFIIHRDERYWPNPNQFDKSRFYSENKDKIMRGSYMPFGIGPRNCAGTSFAMMVLKQTVGNIVRNYKISPGANMNQFLKPDFLMHPFFLQLQDTNFRLEAREKVFLTKQ